MNKIVSATCENCARRFDTMTTSGKYVCRVYHKEYKPKHFCLRHKLLTIEDRERMKFYSKHLMENIKPSSIAKEFQNVENTHKTMTVRRWGPLPKHESPIDEKDIIGLDPYGHIVLKSKPPELPVIYEEIEVENMQEQTITRPNICEFCRYGVPHQTGNTQLCVQHNKIFPNDHTCKKFMPAGYDTLEQMAERAKETLEQLEKEQDQTIKADAGKPRLSLVPMQIIYDIAIIREYGNKKYGDSESWKRVDIERYRDALLRHTLAYIENPDSVDEESGLKHLWHMECNMAFLSYMEAHKND